MILTCTSCSTRYYADDASIGAAGRTVRCAACGHSWFAEPQLELHEAAEHTRDRPEPLTRERVERLRRVADQPGPAPSAAAKFRQQQADRMRREQTRAAIAAWTGTGAALAASVAGMVTFRQDVAELWPRSASAFAAIGLDVNVYGLEFYDIAVERAFDGPTPILLVSGEVRNIGRDEKTAPPIRVSLRDSHSNEVFEIVQALDGQTIAPGGATPFQIRLENPPVDAVDLEATFASFAEAHSADKPAHATPAAPGGAHDGAHGEGALELRSAVDEEGHPLVSEEPAGSLEQSLRGPIDGLAPRFSTDMVMAEGHG